jgi:hypothetical protein
VGFGARINKRTPAHGIELGMHRAHKTLGYVMGAALVLGVYGAPVALGEEAASGMTVLVPGNQLWRKIEALPHGVEVLYLQGDPSKPGPYIYRIRVPTGYKIPPVKYPDDRVVTILQGILWNAEGERYDPSKMKQYGAGTMLVTPANTPHFQWARTEVILQVMGFGPIADPVTYIDSDDDPRRR